jgi:hypothetical protein
MELPTCRIVAEKSVIAFVLMFRDTVRARCTTFLCKGGGTRRGFGRFAEKGFKRVADDCAVAEEKFGEGDDVLGECVVNLILYQILRANPASWNQKD